MRKITSSAALMNFAQRGKKKRRKHEEEGADGLLLRQGGKRGKEKEFLRGKKQKGTPL